MSSWLVVPTTIVTLGGKPEGVREIRVWRWDIDEGQHSRVHYIQCFMYKNGTIVLPSDTAILG